MCEERYGDMTYRKPRLKMKTTESFTRTFICTFQRIMLGKMAQEKSVTKLVEEMKYPMLLITFGDAHFPTPVHAVEIG